MKDVKVAIVGSSESHWTPNQKVKAVLYIRDLLDSMSTPWLYGRVTMVSGGCPKGGVDIWAEEVADEMHIKKIIYKPDVYQWEDVVHRATGEGMVMVDSTWTAIGYRTRNIQIAESCDVLYCIDPKGRVGGGGFWTYSKAKTLGKEVHHVVIE